MDFLLHIFNLSWSLHSFPSIWKTSSIIPIHKMRKPLDSSAFSRPISLTPAYQRFLKASFYLVYCSFWSIIPFSLPARPVSALDGLHLIQFCSFLCPFRMGLTNQGRALGRSSLYDFSKAFDSVWHRALFHKLISAGLSSCFARWIQSFLSDRRACVVYQNHKSRSFRVRRGVPQGSILGAVLFSLFINDLPASLFYSVSCSLYADDLAWSSSPSVFTAVEATQAMFRLERWSKFWRLPLNPSNCECSSFFSVDPHQANLQPSLLSFNFCFHFNPTAAFLGAIFDRTLSFSKHVSSMKAKFFPRLKALRCISASSWVPSKESLSVLCKAFLRPLLTYVSPRCFAFLSATNITELERLHRAASRAITCCLPSPPIPLLLSEAFLPLFQVTLSFLSLNLLSYFRLARPGVKPRFCRSFWRAFGSIHPLMLPFTFPREALLASSLFPP